MPPEDGRLTPDTIKWLWKWKCIKLGTLLWDTWYIAGVLCQLAVPGLKWSECSQLTKHARSTPSAACVSPPEDEQVMLWSWRGPWFLINWIKVHDVGFTVLVHYDARSLYWYTTMHGHYTAILRCTVTILIYYDARSLYWYTTMHGHYTDILRCTVTILIYYDARSLYWYTTMHGHYTDILRCTVNILIRSLYWYNTMHGQQNINFTSYFRLRK
jgi:hypothetical protein